MITSKLLKELREKSIQWGGKNPANSILEQLNSITNDRLNLLLQNKLKDIDSKDLLKDSNGFNIVDYASALNNSDVVVQYAKEYYIPILGEFNVNSELPLIKNLSYDKKPVTKAQNFLMNSMYDFLNQKNFNDSIKLIYPNAGKKTFKLMEKFIDNECSIDFTVFHFAHYCSIYFQDANHFNEVLENVSSVDFFETLIPLHFIMERMGDKRIKNFIIDSSRMTGSELNMLVIDTMNMYKNILKICHDEYEIDFKAINTVKELHDSILTDHNLISRHGENMMLFLERKFPYLEKISKEKFMDYKIIIPQDKSTLVEWGNIMGNCIGGYADTARDGNTIVLALYENEKVKYNIEISPKDGKIKQFVSHSNQRVEQTLHDNFQTLISNHFEGIVLDDDGGIIHLPVDRRFLVRVVKTDSPVNEEEAIFNKMFQMNLSKKVKIENFLDTSSIGMEENIPRGIVSLILEDKNSKGSFCVKLAGLRKTAYTGLLRQFKETNYLNLRSKDYKEIVEEIIQKKKEGYELFFIGVDKLVKINNKTPSAMQSKDYTDFNNEINKILDENTNIFFVISEVKKAKSLTYKDDKMIEPMVSQIFFTHKEKIIDSFFKVDVVKNLFGNSNCILKLKD